MGVPTSGRDASENFTNIKHSRRGVEENMQSVQYRNLTDEELLRYAYMESTDPLVQELCARIARLLDEKTLVKPR